jgi:serine protease Do
MGAIADCELRVANWWGRGLASACIAFALLLASVVVGQDTAASSSSSAPSPAEISPEEMKLVRAAEQARIAAIEKVYGAVVAIYGNDRAGGGSGVLVDPAGYAVTNHHVVAAAGVEGWAGLADGKLYRWKLVGTDPGGDVAVIQLRGKENFPTAPLGNSDTVRVGDWSMAMGNPFTLAEDQRPTVTLGIVSGVNRYQPGEGMNQLVYGNCIQVDSSINPGNSGGPLFNLRGEIIGINGRGSFQERGRVNVGLGYAISSNQVRLFLPELLATKIAQHGTLDAQFGTRAGNVVCETLNLDSPAAKAGLRLGDRLVEFEGASITSANQFTNLITTYPAGWPVKFVVERDRDTGESEQITIYVRLTALPYEPLVRQSERKQPEAEPMPQPEEGGKPDLPPRPVEMRIPKLPLADAGKIRDLEQNRVFARSLLEHWRTQREYQYLGEAFRWSEKLMSGDRIVEAYDLTAGTDGRCRLDSTQGEQKTTIACDGQKYWQQVSGKPAEEITPAKASRNPWFSAAMAITALRTGRSPVGFGTWQLDGADKAQGRLAYRMSASDEQGEQFFLWLGYTEEIRTLPRCYQCRVGLVGPPPQHLLQLLKSGVGVDDDEPIPAVVYSDEPWLHVHPMGLVRGLSEEYPYEEEDITSGEGGFDKVDNPDPKLFQFPAAETPSK